MPVQQRNFLDQTSGLGFNSALVGKAGSVSASTTTQHGMIIVGLPYSCRGQSKMDEVTGGTPYGATTLAGGDGSRRAQRE